MRTLTSAILVFIVTANAVGVFAQTRRTAKPVKAAAASENVSYGLASDETKPELSEAWNSGQLPAPLAVRSTDGDVAIGELAAKIKAGNSESTPALLTALQQAGFFVTNKDGSVLLAPDDGKGQGLVINGWEVASVIKMYGTKKTVSVTELDATLKTIANFREINAASMMMNGVRANAENRENKYLRAWARLIIELGGSEESAAGLAAEGNSAGEERINAIQHLLLFRRLYGDISAVAQRFRMRAAMPGIGENIESVRRPRFYGAMEHSIDAEPVAVPDEAAVPCKMDGNAPTIMDASATIIGTGYGELMGYLTDAFEGTPTGTMLEKVGMAQAVANVILVYAKFIQTYAALEVKISLQGDPPLVRTKNAAAGERKNLKADVRMNIGNWQMYNCIRTAMNLTAGIDFATLNDGPIGDIGVTWSLAQGSAKDTYSNRDGINQSGEQIVGFTQGGPRFQDAGTKAGPGGNGIQVGNARYTKTDGNGVAQIMLEGSPQKNHKSSRSRPVMKNAIVYTTIRMKAGEIKGDMVDVMGQAIGGVAGLISMPAELLYRVSWFAAGELNVPVKDWEDCDGGWTGSITAVTRYRKEEPSRSSGNLTEAIQHKEWNEKWTINLTGDQDRSGGFVNGYFAKGMAEFSQTNYARNFYAQSMCSDKGRGIVRGSKTETFTRKDSAKGEVLTTLYITAGTTSGILTASFGDEITGPTTYDRKYDGPCPLENFTNTKFETSKNPFQHRPQSLNLDIEIDPKNPEVLQGSKTVRNSDGSETTYTWSLTLCK